MFYKNISCSVKTFYGVTFQPGETKEVSNYINDKFMILSVAPINKTVIAQQKPSDKSKKNVSKINESKSEIAKSDELLKADCKSEGTQLVSVSDGVSKEQDA